MPRPASCLCGSCKKCKHRLYMRKWYARMSIDEKREWVSRRNKERVRETDRERNKTIERRAHLSQNAKRWRKTYPEKARAHSVVAYAVRTGKLTKMPCEKCGSRNRIHAHHDDYLKPLEVRWLCPLHHAQERNPVIYKSETSPRLMPPTFPAEQLSMGKFKIIDPAEEYRKMMGDEAFDRQRKLADLEAGRCVCNKPKVKRHWQGGDKLTTRTVHDSFCPKHETWMEEHYDR